MAPSQDIHTSCVKSTPFRLRFFNMPYERGEGGTGRELGTRLSMNSMQNKEAPLSSVVSPFYSEVGKQQ